MMLTVTILALTALQSSEAFNVRSTRSAPANVATRNLDANRRSRIPGHSRLQLSEENDQTLKTQSQKLARLNAMAAKLRAEASAMEVTATFSLVLGLTPHAYEDSRPTLRANNLYPFALQAEQQVVVNFKLAQTFATLDTNQDGSISLQELKDALASQLESVVSEEVALKIMKRFDTSGDGAIQLDEFKGNSYFEDEILNTLYTLHREHNRYFDASILP